ncbi:hypothetical protein [Frankia sp. Cas3]|uniref:hypothetical protein n=1 Tax=Frankia sp. Cas3 TaxID=3073926 RepID=UPI002AD45EF4|nr:hypothetical protein [Frankia sp. Cas3]
MADAASGLRTAPPRGSDRALGGAPGRGAAAGTATGPRPYTGPPTEGFNPFPDQAKQADREEIGATDQFATIPGDDDRSVVAARRPRATEDRATDGRATEDRAQTGGGTSGTGSRPVRPAQAVRPAAAKVRDGRAQTSARAPSDKGRSAGTGTRGRTSGRRPAVIVLTVLAAVVFMIVGFSIGQALASPGSATAQSRVGTWARDHHLAFLVDGVEKLR